MCTADDFDSTPTFADFGQISPQEGFLVRNWATISIEDQGSGGIIDPVILQVDKFNAVRINQSTAGRTLAVPEPTIATHGKMFAVINVGIEAFGMLGVVVEPRSTLLLFWDGATWSRVI